MKLHTVTLLPPVELTSALASQFMNFSLDLKCSKTYRRVQSTYKGERSQYTV